jgi:hypothetical protein
VASRKKAVAKTKKAAPRRASASKKPAPRRAAVKRPAKGAKKR